MGRLLARLPAWTGPAVVGLMAAGFGRGCLCANAEYSRAYDAHVRAQTDRYRHHATKRQVHAEIVDASPQWGFALDPAQDVSAWDGGSENRERLELELAQDGGVAVRLFTRREVLSPQRYHSAGTIRSHALEREVFERLVPGKEATDAEVAAHSYELPSDRVWTEVVDVLGQRGYMIGSLPPIDGESSSSQWVVAEDESGRHRYEATVSPVADEHLRVEIHKRREKAVGTRRWLPDGRPRRHDLELELIARRDPDTAAAIERVARDQGQQAYDAALDRGGFACGR